MRYLERSVGKTGLLAIQPMLHMSHKDLWQLYVLGKS
jgi:protease PrsW